MKRVSFINKKHSDGKNFDQKNLIVDGKRYLCKKESS